MVVFGFTMRGASDAIVYVLEADMGDELFALTKSNQLGELRGVL